MPIRNPSDLEAAAKEIMGFYGRMMMTGALFVTAGATIPLLFRFSRRWPPPNRWVWRKSANGVTSSGKSFTPIDPGDGTYLYSVRIDDYSTNIRWYESPRTAATSFILPADLNLPKGSSYKWRVCVLDASGNNYRSTDYRTFTINGPG